MLLTAVSYGRMARVYPSAGSAYAYVRGEFGTFAGYLVGWGIVLDYLLKFADLHNLVQQGGAESPSYTNGR